MGGEAAVAVARLLKQQGLKRQVIAITHNPVIAAAADQHFVVSRCEDDSYGTSEVSERTGTRKINVTVRALRKDLSSKRCTGRKEN